MELIKEQNHNYTCCKKVMFTSEIPFNYDFTRICSKPATYRQGNYFFCRHHAKMGRYVARIGDVGDIIARFDTEAELRANIHLYSGCIMQKLSRSGRKDLV